MELEFFSIIKIGEWEPLKSLYFQIAEATLRDAILSKGYTVFHWINYFMAWFLLMIYTLPVYLMERYKLGFVCAKPLVNLESHLCKHLHLRMGANISVVKPCLWSECFIMLQCRNWLMHLDDSLLGWLISASRSYYFFLISLAFGERRYRCKLPERGGITLRLAEAVRNGIAWRSERATGGLKELCFLILANGTKATLLP